MHIVFQTDINIYCVLKIPWFAGRSLADPTKTKENVEQVDESYLYAEKLANDTVQKAINCICDQFLNIMQLNRQLARRDCKFIVHSFERRCWAGDPCLKSLLPGQQRTLSVTPPPVSMLQVSEL